MPSLRTLLLRIRTAMLAQAATPDAPADAVASGWQAIVEADGLGISITGMLIVFVALTAISVFIGLLPKILGVLEPYLPEVGHHAAPDPAAGTAKPTAGTDPRMVAAIAWARHQDGK